MPLTKHCLLKENTFEKLHFTGTRWTSALEEHFESIRLGECDSLVTGFLPGMQLLSGRVQKVLVFNKGMQKVCKAKMMHDHRSAK